MSMFRITVEPRQVLVAYRHGRLVDVLEPGRHRRRWGARYVPVDLREALLALAAQEVPTADGLTVKVSAIVRYAVTDPVAWLERAAQPLGEVHLATQVALREAVASLTAEEATRRDGGIAAETVTAAVAAVAAGVGVTVAEVVVRDVVLPRQIRDAALELATARSRGAAQSKAARAETAALRSLANGARLLDTHPGLARLRLVQAAPAGTQLVLRVGDVPEPVGPADDA